jgi:hypothetical protein
MHASRNDAFETMIINNQSVEILKTVMPIKQ